MSTSSSAGAAARLVDARGKSCPVPVILLAKALPEVAVGEEVAIAADDPGAKVDIPVWCRMKHQELVDVVEDEPAADGSRRSWTFHVRRTS